MKNLYVKAFCFDL